MSLAYWNSFSLVIFLSNMPNKSHIVKREARSSYRSLFSMRTLHLHYMGRNLFKVKVFIALGIKNDFGTPDISFIFAFISSACSVLHT